MKAELEGIEGDREVKIHIVSHRVIQKKIWMLKTPGHDSINEFWFKKITSIHERLTFEMNRCVQETDNPEWMTNVNNLPDPESPRK